MPDLLEEFPEDEAATNNNPDEVTSEYLESELWKALRNGNQPRFQSLLETIQAGNLIVDRNISIS